MEKTNTSSEILKETASYYFWLEGIQTRIGKRMKCGDKGWSTDRMLLHSPNNWCQQWFSCCKTEISSHGSKWLTWKLFHRAGGFVLCLVWICKRACVLQQGQILILRPSVLVSCVGNHRVVLTAFLVLFCLYSVLSQPFSQVKVI